MSDYQNIVQRNDEDEISIIELFQMVFNHFFMIVGIVLVFSIIGVASALLFVPEKHNVEASIEIKSPIGTGTLSKYGIEFYSANSIMYTMFSKSSLESAIPDGTEGEYSNIVKPLKYENVKNTSSWTITASEVRDTELYISMINTIVEKQIEALDYYKRSAEIGRTLVEDRINEFNVTLSSLDGDEQRRIVVDSLITAKSDLQIINSYIDSLSSVIIWNEKPVAGDENVGTSKAMVCIVFFLAGGVIGVLAAWIIDFSDKHIYNTEKLIPFCNGGGKLLSSIPLYKNPEEISSSEFAYIKSKISPDYKNIVVTSITPKAGKTMIADGLKKETSADVYDAASISTKPEVFESIKNSDYALIILRAGIDTFSSLDKLITDLKLAGTDYGFILNAVDISDKNASRYASDDAYIKHRWLLDSWYRFYHRNYR